MTSNNTAKNIARNKRLTQGRYVNTPTTQQKNFFVEFWKDLGDLRAAMTPANDLKLFTQKIASINRKLIHETEVIGKMLIENASKIKCSQHA